MKTGMGVLIFARGLSCGSGPARADAPGQINFQGRVLVPRAEEEANERGMDKGEKERSKLFPFTGTGLFKFVIVDDLGSVLWTNAPNNFTAPPPAEVSVQVKKGIFNVALGDPSLGMPFISSDVFKGPNRFLRVFFRTPKLTASAELLPPQKLLTVPYAFTSAVAQSLPAGATIQTGTFFASSATFNVMNVSSAVIDQIFVPTQLKVGDSIYLTRAGNAPLNSVVFTGGRGTIFNSPTLPPVVSIAGGSSINIEAAGGLFLNTVSTGMVFMSTQSVSRVGIGLPGTTSPSEKLEVFGNIKSDFGMIASTGVFSSTVTATSITASSGAFVNVLTLAGSPVLTQAMLDGAAGLASTQTFTGINTFGTIFSSAIGGTTSSNGVNVSSSLVVNGNETVSGSLIVGRILNPSSNLTVGGPGFSVTSVSSFTVAGQDAAGFSLQLSSGLLMPGGTLNAGSVAASFGAFSSRLTMGGSPVLTQASLDGAVAKTGDTMTGQLTLSASTLTVAGQDAAGFSLKLSSGLSTPGGTINAGLFIGDGAGLTSLNPADIGAGGLPANVTVQDASIAGVSGSKVGGNISGSAANVTGTVAVGNGGTGTSAAFTAGSVVFAGAGGTYGQNNANFFWDNANLRLGIGTASPSNPLSVSGNANVTGTLAAGNFSGSGSGLSGVPWSGLTGFPATCPSGQFVQGVGSSLTCAAATTSHPNSAFVRILLATTNGDATTMTPVPNSTLNLTTTGGRVLLSFSCPIATVDFAHCVTLGVFVDGQLIDGEDSIGGFNRFCTPAAVRDVMGGFTHLTESPLSAGLHTFTLAWQTNSSLAVLANTLDHTVCQFFAVEQ